ncbi:MAG: serine hydrolase [Saprospiraceae bacterium]
MRNIWGIITLLCAPFILFAQVDYKKLDAYYEKAVKDWGVPSMSIGIVKDGKLVFSKGYGVLEVGKTAKPDENTLYAIASISKAFTAAAIATLVQEGKLSWNDKVQKYLPYFELYDPYVSREVTIRDLLSHRVGLGTFSGDVIWYKSDLTAEEIIKRLKYLPKSFDFRAGYGYSNVMYITAGEIITKITGKKWDDYIQEKFLTPLNMNRTVASIHDLDKKGNYAMPHGMKDGKTVVIPWVSWDNTQAMGGLISSVKDMSNWMIFNLNHGIWGKDTILTAASRNIMWTPHSNFTVNQTDPKNPTHFNGYGLGWGLSDYYGRLRASHSGGYDGMLSLLNLIPDENLGVIILTNGVKTPMSAVMNYTLDAFLKNPEKDWSAQGLQNWEKNQANDTRVSDRKKARVLNTKPSLPLEQYAGTYYSDIYGNINITLVNNQFKLSFEHSPDLAATLRHWHYDVWEIVWDKPQAWFDFGTVKFNLDNNLKINGMDFDVPNDDFFFEEFKPRKVK